MSSVKPGNQGRVLKVVEKITEGVETAAQSEMGNDLITLSTGVVLEVFAGAPIGRLMDIDRLIKDPPVPVVEIDGRDVENPASPTYQAAMRDVQNERGIAAIDSIVVLCTRVHSVPEGILNPEDPEWAETLEVLNYGTPGKVSRYLLWVKLKAAPTDNDWVAVTSAAMRKAGIREEDVSAALDGFRDNGRGEAPPDGDV
jgi:hypothetical protein